MNEADTVFRSIKNAPGFFINDTFNFVSLTIAEIGMFLKQTKRLCTMPGTRQPTRGAQLLSKSFSKKGNL
jgi:hypothetical protein